MGEGQRERERELQVDSTLSMEPDGDSVNPTTLWSLPEPKPRVGHPTDCATLVPPYHILMYYIVYFFVLCVVSLRPAKF